MQAAAETIRVQALLQAQGILAVVFKGAALAQLAYGSLDTKHSCDVDLLLSPDKVRAAAGLLMAAGYRLVRPAATLNDAQWGSVLRLAKEVALAPPEWGPAIELHWTLGQDRRLTTWLSPRAPAREIVLPGHGTVRTFEDSDLFAYLCVHGAGHLWIRLKWLADFHALGSRPRARAAGAPVPACRASRRGTGRSAGSGHVRERLRPGPPTSLAAGGTIALGGTAARAAVAGRTPGRRGASYLDDLPACPSSARTRAWLSVAAVVVAPDGPRRHAPAPAAAAASLPLSAPAPAAGPGSPRVSRPRSQARNAAPGCGTTLIFA